MNDERKLGKCYAISLNDFNKNEKKIIGVSFNKDEAIGFVLKSISMDMNNNFFSEIGILQYSISIEIREVSFIEDNKKENLIANKEKCGWRKKGYPNITGGISCRWTSDCNNKYEVSPSRYDFSHCPYCGKEINILPME